MTERVLRIFFDWGHPWPLWETGTDKYTMEPTDYGFSPSLTDLLRRWREAWVPVADFAIGETDQQPTAEHDDLYEALAEEALERIRAEVPSGITVCNETERYRP